MNHEISNSSFLNSENALYIAGQFKIYIQNPANVSKSWQDFFQRLNDDHKSVLLDLSRGSKYSKPKNTTVFSTTTADTKDVELSLKAAAIADAYRRWGHYSANLDPLKLSPPKGHTGLNTKAHTLNNQDLDRPIKGFKLGRRETLRGIIEQLAQVYCGNAGYEYMHIPNMEEVNWIKRRLETAPFALTEDDEVEIFEWLVKAELFEHFLAKKFPGAKRFGVEGCDALIPVLHDLLTRAAADELGNAVIGMAHRGRLNTLYNIMGRPYEEVFAKFMNKTPSSPGLGDVKYHVGGSIDVMLHDKPLHVSLLYNPSHLEAINPVVMGNVWAKQQDGTPNALGILVHGDAAFAGQGVNAETFLMSQVPGYSVGGIIHIITNNQVGFTANPNELKSTDYASDLAKSINAPIFHVNADDIESCIFVSWLAYSYRQEFKKDVVIDIIGYRRYGHNEGDEPNFTQPIMYTKIKSHPSVLTQYQEFLTQKNTLTLDHANQIRSQYESTLVAAYNRATDWDFKEYTNHPAGRWAQIHPNNHANDSLTGVKIDLLKQLGTQLSTPPKEFDLNPKIARQLAMRKQMIETGTDIDWATGELLAYGTLLTEGYPIRISGEDCVRGTFSHRHVGLYDQSTNKVLFPINSIQSAKAQLCVYNSILSEYGVMGFEYGAALANPNRLVIWEGQFGDFANGAQITIDQFIASAETKWGLYNGLVLLLPHGLEGQGPEHSSARLERFLQLCAEDNMRVINPTTPANMFHALRRQIHNPNRKPLVVMTPKSLLRHKMAVSSLNDMAEGTTFQQVITLQVSDVTPERIVLCSGKIYYDLLASLSENPKIMLIRLEQLYPFPSQELAAVLNQYTSTQIVWCQEEPQNMGAWSHVYFALKNMGLESMYIGRKPAASPASGYIAVHQAEQSAIINEALTIQRT
jgi:2-oxoglutarate dehydrogenase E1 component